MMLVAVVVVALFAQSYGKLVSVGSDSVVFARTEQVQDIVGGGGLVTEFLNCDKSSEYRNYSTGDFETIRRCRVLEVELQRCLIPCKTPEAMECRDTQPHKITADVIYTQCLSLTDDDTDPARGLYAKNTATWADKGGACNGGTWLAEGCKDALGERCNAPDSECRWFCVEEEAERDAFCAERMANITETRTLVVGLLKRMVKKTMKSKRGLLFRSPALVRSLLAQQFLDKAIENNEDEELILYSRLLQDDSINWEN